MVSKYENSRLILDDIKVDFLHIGYGKSQTGFNVNDNVDYNQFEVTISYNDKKIRHPYNVGTVNLKGVMNNVLENMFKIDLIGRIIIDCYPFKSKEEVKSCLVKKGFDESEEYYQQAFDDVKAQSEKFRTLFTENDLQQMKKELKDWLRLHPEEAKTYGKLELEN